MKKIQAILTPQVKTLGDILDANGHEARVVGGAVRDFLQGKQPKDYDLATTALPEQVISIFEAEGFTVVPTGLQHGTVTVVLEHEPYEITTLRVDEQTDGRHAVVSFTTDWEADAARRDLTYNAMSVGMDGTLYDYFGGVDDLQEQITRFVGKADDRIKEDYLRILRFFRFAARSTACPVWDRDTLQAIWRNRMGLRQISGERIWLEMSKVLVSKWSNVTMQTMAEYSVDVALEMPAINTQALQHARDVRSDDPAVMLACFMGGWGPNLKAISEKWRLSKEVRDTGGFVLGKAHWKLRDVKHYLAKTPHEAVQQARAKRMVKALAEFNCDHTLLEACDWEVPVCPVDGRHFIELGLTPKGRKFGELVRFVFDTWADSDYTATKEELLNEATAWAMVNAGKE